MPKTDAEHATAAREYAAEYFAEAMDADARGRPVEAHQAFDDALNAEKWAVFYEARVAAKNERRSQGRLTGGPEM